MIQREDLADQNRLPRFRNRLHSVLVRFGTEQFGRFLLYVPSPADYYSLLIPFGLRLLCPESQVQLRISCLVTGLVTVNGNRGGEGPEFFPLKGKHRENSSVSLRLVCRSA